MKKLRLAVTLCLLAVFVIGNRSKAASYYVSDPRDCPSEYLAQTCTDPPNVCGVSSTVQCYNTSSINPKSTSSTVESASIPTTTSGGYYIDCIAPADNAVPYCDNNGAQWCLQKADCSNAQRKTTCAGGQWATAICGPCKTGYKDCNEDEDCIDYTLGEHINDRCTTTGGAPGFWNDNCTCVGSTLKLGPDSVSQTNIIVQSVANTLMYINGDKVNIGTSSFAIGTKLYLYDVASGPIIALSGLDSNYRGLTIKNTNDIEQWFIGNNNSNNFVIRATGSNDILTVNASTSNVGIGTTTPGAKLDVNGSLAVRGSVSFTGPSYIGASSRLLMVDNEGNVSATTTLAGVSMPSGNTGQTLRYGASAWEATSTIHITDGKVGIKTNTPTEALSVEGNVYINTGESSNTFVVHNNPEQNNQIRVDGDAGNVILSESFGNVGIGAPAPDAKLDVNGSLAVRGSVSFTGPLYTGTGSRLLMVDSSGNVSATTTLAGVSMPSGNTGQTLRYGASAWEATSTIYIKNDGNVGIKTNTPTEALSVEGNVYINTGESSNTFVVHNGPSDYNQIRVDGDAGNVILSESFGNVGIGAPAPDAKLDVNGSLAVRGSVSFTGPLYTGTGSRLLMVDSDGNVSATTTLAGVSMPSGNAGQTLRYGASGWEATSTIYIKNDGNVGIGDTAPTNKLSVAGNITGSGSLSITGTATSSYFMSNLGIGSLPNGYWNKFVDVSGNGNSAYIVKTGSINAIMAATDSGTPADTGYNFTYTGQQMVLGTVTNQPLNFITNGGSKMFLSNNGKLGIGTTSPAAALHIYPQTDTEGLRVVSSNYSPLVIVNSSSVDLFRVDETGKAHSNAYCDINGANCFNPSSGWSSNSYFATITSSTYSGNNNDNPGYNQAHSLCNAQLAGSHVCSAEEILNTIRDNKPLPSVDVWIFNGPPGYEAVANDCAARTINSAGTSGNYKYGSYWQAPSDSYPQGKGLLMKCNVSLQLACCR